MNPVDWTIAPTLPVEVHRAYAEMRKHERTLTFKTGKLRSKMMVGPVLCAIVNVSEGGACILVPDATTVPLKVILEFDDGTQYDCQVCWRSRNRLGVSFI
jgi:hypothetical protein